MTGTRTAGEFATVRVEIDDDGIGWLPFARPDKRNAMSHPFDICTSVALPATPEQVWQAVATPQGQAAWFMAVPAEHRFPDPSDNPAVEVWEPPRHLRVRPDATMALEYLIEAADGGTAVLRFVHSGVLEPRRACPAGATSSTR